MEVVNREEDETEGGCTFDLPFWRKIKLLEEFGGDGDGAGSLDAL